LKQQPHALLNMPIRHKHTVKAVTGLSTSTWEPSLDPAGTWKWTAPTNPDGTTPNVTFTLKLQGETLTGTRMSGNGTIVLINGVFKVDEISFQTPRRETAFPKGKITFTTFSGRLSGDTVKGKVEIYVDDKIFVTQDWEIKRVKK
jgi:hypothetical protein